MKQLIIVPVFFLILFGCSDQSQDTNQENSEDRMQNYILDNHLYFERLASEDEGNYDSDNRIYTIGREFIYSYYHIKDLDTFLVQALPIEKEISGYFNLGEFERAWTFVLPGSCDSVISHISVKTVDPKELNGNIRPNPRQSVIKLTYYNGDEEFGFAEHTGVIENYMNVWIHPHRAKLFRILELNPFPFIQRPFEIGNTWQWQLKIGQHWGDPRWLQWEGNLDNQYQYEITDKREIDTSLGTLATYVIDATATNSMGSTALRSYFNEQYGFVKLEYTNINGSRTIMELEEVRQHAN